MPSPRDTSTSGQARKGYFSLKTQFENVGDALINRELVKLVAARMQVHVDLSRCPPDFVRTLGFAGQAAIVSEPSTLKVLLGAIGNQMAGGQSYYFLSPGGYFGEKQGAARRAAWINTGILWLLSKLGVRVCHLAVSYDSIGPEHARILRARSRLLYAHHTRDQASADYVAGLGIKVDGIMPDLAFSAAGPTTAESAERPCLAISFRTDQSPDQASNVEALVDLLDRSLPPAIPFKLISQVKRDEGGLGALQGRLRNRQSTVLDTSSDIEACLMAYRDCSHIVSNRLHALLCGSLSGATPIAAIDRAANAKIVGLFDALGVEENLFDLGTQDGHTELVSAIAGGRLKRIDTLGEKARLEDAFSRILA